MLRALSEFAVLGIATTIEYLREIVASEAFAAGRTQTDFIEKHMADRRPAAPDESAVHEALVAAALFLSSKTGREAPGRRRESSPWDALGSWSIGRRSS